jgi:hypothetical protein
MPPLRTAPDRISPGVWSTASVRRRPRPGLPTGSTLGRCPPTEKPRLSNGLRPARPCSWTESVARTDWRRTRGSYGGLLEEAEQEATMR